MMKYSLKTIDTTPDCDVDIYSTLPVPFFNSNWNVWVKIPPLETIYSFYLCALDWDGNAAHYQITIDAKPFCVPP
jgi:hypothetical protein